MGDLTADRALSEVEDVAAGKSEWRSTSAAQLRAEVLAREVRRLRAAHTLSAVATEVLRHGVTIRDDAALLSTMVTYPSGSGVVVRIRQDGDSWIVDDFHGGPWERPEIPSELWAEVAAREATGALGGLDLDDGARVSVRAPLDRLAGAVANVANASATLCRMVVERWCSDCDDDPCTDDECDGDPDDCLGCGVCDACTEATAAFYEAEGEA